MRVRIEESSLTSTSSRLAALADATGELAAAVRGASWLDVDAQLATGVRAVTGVSSDALHLVASDLDLIVRTLRAANDLYGRVESATVAVADAVEVP